jgi:AraC family transcriptional regulator
MFSEPLPANVISTQVIDANGRQLSHAATSKLGHQFPYLGDERQNASAHEPARVYNRYSSDITTDTVRISPSDAVTRRAVGCRGVTAEIVQAVRPDRIEYCFCASVHMLVLYEQGVRDDGETSVQGLRRSTLRDPRNKLTFVPAGHTYRESHELRALSRIAYFYFDPVKMSLQGDKGSAPTPRMYFENAAVSDTARKLISSFDSASEDNHLYREALGVVLAHELGCLDSTKAPVQALIRGGLAAWQQRVAATYIEEHLAEQISLKTLARLVRLSPYHFCRAFKQSFGMPPNRYHTSRRIELAKILLAKPTASVTEIGLTLGFSQTSSFSAAFRRATGFTPTSYHRSLG